MLFGWYELVDEMGWASSLGLGLINGCKPFLLHSCCRGPLGLMDFGPLANFWGFGLGLLWTKKTGLYTSHILCQKNAENRRHLFFKCVSKKLDMGCYFLYSRKWSSALGWM